MTMAAYHNCDHDPDGWCLQCVGKMAYSLSNAESELQKANAEITALQQSREMLYEELAIRDVWLDALKAEVLASREHRIQGGDKSLHAVEACTRQTNKLGVLKDGAGLRAFTVYLTKATYARLKDGYKSAIALSFRDRTQSGTPNEPFVLVRTRSE